MTRLDMADVALLIELPDVYDGWSIAVLADGTHVNRWADPDDSTRARPSYERRYAATADYIASRTDEEAEE